MIAAIIQARLESTRLPNKVLSNIAGHELIWHIIERIKKSNQIDKIIVATTKNSKDDLLVEWAIKNSILSFRGSEDNVLERYYEAATHFKADTIIRITADDPFKDPEIVDQVVLYHKKTQSDVTTNNNPPTFPEGLDVEVFSYAALKIANEKSEDSFEKEHVTQYFYRNADKFKISNYSNTENLSHLRWTLDTLDDLHFAKEIYKELYVENKCFLFNDILSLLKAKPYLTDINKNVKRSAMYQNIKK